LDSHGFIVSDGSFQNDAGMAAWIIEGQLTQPRIIGTMIILGSPKDHSSFHSKLAGIFRALCTLEALNLWFHCLALPVCMQQKICFGLHHIHIPGPTDRTSHRPSTGSQVQGLPAWHPDQVVHVKGHQDGVTPTILACGAWVNIEADLLAKETVNPSYHGPVHY